MFWSYAIRCTYICHCYIRTVPLFFWLLILFLEEYLSHINSHMATLRMVYLFLFITFNLSVSLYLKWISDGPYMLGSYFCFIHSDILCLLIGLFKSLAFIILINMVESINLLLVFCLSPLFLVLFLFLCLLLHCLNIF